MADNHLPLLRGRISKLIVHPQPLRDNRLSSYLRISVTGDFVHERHGLPFPRLQHRTVVT